MNLKEDDQVSAVALVVESETDTAAAVTGALEGPLTEAEDAALADGSANGAPVDIGAPLPEGADIVDDEDDEDDD